MMNQMSKCRLYRITQRQTFRGKQKTEHVYTLTSFSRYEQQK